MDSSSSFPDGETSNSDSLAIANAAASTVAAAASYENQKRRDWNSFGQFLKNHRPPLSLSRCSGAHVLEFIRYLDQFGKTKVHEPVCPFYGHPNMPAPCPCPLRQAWGSLDALIGRLSAAYEENGGKPETNPFGDRAVRLYLRDVRDLQSNLWERSRSSKMAMIPLGYRFVPTDEELVTDYLLRWAMGLPLNPSGADHQHILHKHLYGDNADPCNVFQDVHDSRWDIFEGDDFKKDKRVIYVITKLSKVSNGKTRIARKAGGGTWSGQTPPKKIYNESGQWVGTMRMLFFEGHAALRDQYHWIMHEYSLDGIYSKNCQDYVICRITRVFDKTRSCLQPQQQPVSGKKRSPQEGIAASDKRQKKAIISSSSADHEFLGAQVMLSESSPGLICYRDWGEEDFNILNDDNEEEEIISSFSGVQQPAGQSIPPDHRFLVAQVMMPELPPSWNESSFDIMSMIGV